MREFGRFDLVFADAAGGKLEGLDGTIDALAPGGVLVVDDMDPALHADDGLLEPLGAVREQILADPSLVAAELDFASGVIVATKRAGERLMAREQRLVFGEVADLYDRRGPGTPSRSSTTSCRTAAARRRRSGARGGMRHRQGDGAVRRDAASA